MSMVDVQRRRMVGLLAWGPSAAMAADVPAPPDFVLSGSLEVRNSFYGRWLLQIYAEAFRRLGYHFVYDAYPLRRSSHVTDRGQSDGEIHRVQSYGLSHPNLVRVAEPHFSSNFVALAVRPGLKLKGWDSLRGSGLKVGTLAGTMRVEQMLPTLIPPADISIAPGIESGMRMLYAGRFDVLINGEGLIQDWLYRAKADPQLDRSRCYVAGVIEPIDFHAYLAAKHAQLAGRLAETLRQMKREGLIEQYRRAALAQPSATP